MTTGCPQCNTIIKRVITAGPGDHRLAPCNHIAPIEFRRAFMHPVVTDGSGIFLDPHVPSDDEPYYLVKTTSSGAKRTNCHLPDPTTPDLPKCGNTQPNNYIEKSPATCRTMGVTVCENCITNYRPHDIYHIAKTPGDRNEHEQVLLLQKHEQRQTAPKLHYAHNDLPDTVYIPPAEYGVHITIDTVTLRPKCEVKASSEFCLVDPNSVDREICKLCTGTRAHTGNHGTPMATRLKRLDKDAVRGEPVTDGGNKP